MPRKKVSSGTLPAAFEKSQFLDATEPPSRLPTVECPDCKQPVDLNVAKRLGAVSWTCTTEECGSVLRVDMSILRPEPGEDDDAPAAPKKNGLVCCACGEAQYEEGGSITCAQGHAASPGEKLGNYIARMEKKRAEEADKQRAKAAVEGGSAPQARTPETSANIFDSTRSKEEPRHMREVPQWVKDATAMGELRTSESISVTWGPELISPRRFNTITIGPFTYETCVQDGETLEQAYARANETVAAIGEGSRKKRVAAFVKYLSDNFGEPE